MWSEAQTNWPERKLTDIAQLPRGQVDPREMPYREQILLAPDHVESRTGRITGRESAESQGAMSGKYLVHPGDVILSKIRPALRKVALADFVGTCSADMYPMKPTGEVLSAFLWTTLLSERFSQFAESVSGRTGIPKLNRDDLSAFSLCVPPPPEQQRIVEVLDGVTETERIVEATIAKLHIVRQALINSVSAGKTAPLSSVLVSVESGWSPVCDMRPPGPDDWGVLSLSAVTTNRYRPEAAKRLPRSLKPRISAEVRAGDVLMARANGAHDLVGASCVVSETPKHRIFPDLVYRLTVDRDRIKPIYLGLMVSTASFRQQVDAAMRSTSGQYKISKKDVQEFRIPAVSLQKQRNIILKVEAIDRKIEVQSTELHKLRALKQGLVDDLLSRRVQVGKVG